MEIMSIQSIITGIMQTFETSCRMIILALKQNDRKVSLEVHLSFDIIKKICFIWISLIYLNFKTKFPFHSL